MQVVHHMVAEAIYGTSLGGQELLTCTLHVTPLYFYSPRILLT